MWPIDFDKYTKQFNEEMIIFPQQVIILKNPHGKSMEERKH